MEYFTTMCGLQFHLLHTHTHTHTRTHARTRTRTCVLRGDATWPPQSFRDAEFDTQRVFSKIQAPPYKTEFARATRRPGFVPLYTLHSRFSESRYFDYPFRPSRHLKDVIRVLHEKKLYISIQGNSTV
jgi:hypothetical protein